MALYDGPQPSPSPGQPADLQSTINAIASSGAVGGGSGTGPNPKDPPVFMGYKTNPATVGSMFVNKTQSGPYAPGYKPGLGSFATTPVNRIADIGTVSSVSSQYYGWDQKTKDKFLANLELAGYDSKNMKDGQLAQLWGAYVEQAAQYYQAGVTVSPWDIMSKDMAQREAYAKTPRTVSQTSTSYDLSTEGDAKAIFYAAAQQLLGRDPTKSESSEMQKRLNALERANPTITKMTSNYIGDQLQSQTSTSEGGVKEGARQMEAMDMAKAKPEYGAYQAATTYFGALMDMLGGMK